MFAKDLGTRLRQFSEHLIRKGDLGLGYDLRNAAEQADAQRAVIVAQEQLIATLQMQCDELDRDDGQHDPAF